MSQPFRNSDWIHYNISILISLLFLAVVYYSFRCFSYIYISVLFRLYVVDQIYSHQLWYKIYFFIDLFFPLGCCLSF